MQRHAGKLLQRWVCFVLCGLLMPTANLYAQAAFGDQWNQVTALAADTSVEIELKNGKRLKGNLVQATATDLSVLEKAGAVTVTRAEIKGVYRVIAKPRSKSAVKGALIGGAIGVGVGLLFYLPGRPDQAIEGPVAAGIGALGAGIGAGLGAVFSKGRQRMLIYRSN